MAKEKSLDLAAVQTWLAAWKEKDLFSDAAVRDLLGLIPDNNCMVVITCGVGCPPRSLVFHRLRRVRVIPPTSTIPGRLRAIIAAHRRFHAALLDPDRMAMFHGPTSPMAPIIGQLWLKEGVTPEWLKSVPSVTQKIFRWDGTQWLLHGHLTDDALISMQGKTECGFAEALARAREHAQRLNL
jgi:hypothetical protein